MKNKMKKGPKIDSCGTSVGWGEEKDKPVRGQEGRIVKDKGC